MMITVWELLVSLDRKEVFDDLIREYEGEEKNLEGYQFVWDHLLTLTPEPTDLTCRIVMVDDSPPWYDVSGEDPNGEIFGIEFVKWEKWLSMPVKAAEDMSCEHALAHILFEMTFMGFTQDEVQDKFDDLKDAVAEIEEINADDMLNETKH